MTPETLRGQVVSKAVAEYIKTGNNKYGKGWKRTLARELMKQNPKMFVSLDAVRNMIRERCGATGERHRKYAKFAHDVTYCKILILDIETLPARVYTFNMWETNISYEQIIKDWSIVTWSAKWLFEDRVYSAKMTPKEAIMGDDKRIVQSLWQMLDKCDMCITHNGTKFDHKKINTRFLKYGIAPPSSFIIIDTYLHNKKQFAHSSNKLDAICKSLALGGKKEHEGFALWVKCDNGDKQALKNMEDYNVKDVTILEDLYLYMRAWIRPHPNTTVYISNEKVERCPTCGSYDLKHGIGRFATNTQTYEEFRCNNCNSVGKERQAQYKGRAKYVKISVPR